MGNTTPKKMRALFEIMSGKNDGSVAWHSAARVLLGRLQKAEKQPQQPQLVASFKKLKRAVIATGHVFGIGSGSDRVRPVTPHPDLTASEERVAEEGLGIMFDD